MKLTIEEQAKQSKRYAWIADHRGGPLSQADRRQLIKWARECVEHVLHLLEGQVDQRITDALHTAKEWEDGSVSTGLCMKSALAAHAAARSSDNEAHKNVARGAGQAVATAHMADHCLGGAFFALKAMKSINNDLLVERQWQDERLSILPHHLQELVKKTWQDKKLDQRI